MHDPIANILLVLTILVGIGVLTLVGVLVTVAVVALKTRTRVMKILDRVENAVVPHLGPVSAQVHSVVDDLTPKVKQMGTNIAAITDTLRSEAQHISASLGDVVERTHQQAARVDGMVSNTLSGIGSATHAVQEGIAIPFRHLGGVLESVRAGLSSLRKRQPHNGSYRRSGDYTEYPTPIRKVDPDQI